MTTTVAFNSFLRGAGKSNLLANIAALFALGGRRVGVVDLDEAAPTLPLLFGMERSAVDLTLEGVLLGRAAFEDAVYDVTPQAAALAGGRILLVPLVIEACYISDLLREGLDTDRLDASLREFARSRRLDALLLDSSAGLNEISLAALSMSDVLLQVLRLERSNYQGTAVTLDLARRLGVPRIGLVAGIAPAGIDAVEASAQLSETYGCPVAVVLPYAAELAALGSAGLFPLAYPHHPLTAELRRLAGWIG